MIRSSPRRPAASRRTPNAARVLVLWGGLLAGAAFAPGQQPRHWWEREPLRIIDLVTAFGRIDSFPPDQIAARKTALLFNAEHLHVMGLRRGLDDQAFFFASQVAEKQNDDYLRRYLPEARKHGLRVMIYFNVHWYNPEFAERHPDWLQVREDGRPLSGVYETGTAFCVNGPWREWVFRVVRDLAAYPIDGIFYDGPIFFADTCYCRYCQEKFLKAYGTKLPPKKERKGGAFRDLLEFQASSLADFLRDSQRILKGINPEIALYMNGGVRGANWATGRLNRVLVAEQDLLGSEGGFVAGDLTRVPVWKPGATAKLLESQAGGKPRVIFSAASHKPWTFSLLPAAELRLLYADSIANAASVWFGVTAFELDQPEMKALAEMNALVAKNASYFQDTRSEARAALVWSDVTANYYQGSGAQMIDIDRVPQRSEVGNLDGEFSGFADALLRSHTPYDVVDDVTLEREDLGRYSAIFLPNVACMSDRAAARLKAYVREGGSLFATFESSLYDQTGIRRAEFALAEVFGISGGKKIAGPTRWDFMKSRASSPLLEGLGRELIPSTTYHVRVEPKGSRPLLYFTRPLAGRYDGVPEVSDEPALMVNRYGRGQAVYFSGDLGNAVNTFHLPEWYRLIANAARELSPSPVTLQNAPSSVEVVLRSQVQESGKRFLLHLVNFTGEMTRPIESVVPLENLRVSVKSSPPRRIMTLMRPQTLSFQTDASGRVHFVLPRLQEYEVVVIER